MLKLGKTESEWIIQQHSYAGIQRTLTEIDKLMFVIICHKPLVIKVEGGCKPFLYQQLKLLKINEAEM